MRWVHNWGDLPAQFRGETYHLWQHIVLDDLTWTYEAWLGDPPWEHGPWETVIWGNRFASLPCYLLQLWIKPSHQLTTMKPLSATKTSHPQTHNQDPYSVGRVTQKCKGVIHHTCRNPGVAHSMLFEWQLHCPTTPATGAVTRDTCLDGLPLGIQGHHSALQLRELQDLLRQAGSTPSIIPSSGSYNDHMVVGQY